MSPRLLAPFAGLVLVAMIALAAPARADVVVDGRARFPEALEHGGQRFVLAGTGLLRWKWIVKVYAASFYFGEGAAPDP